MSGVPFRAKALFEYSSPHEDDLQFGIGQIITVTEEEDAEWYNGEYVDDAGIKHRGIFPQNFVEKYEPAAPPRPVRRAKKEPEAADDEPNVVAPVSPKTEQTHHDAEPESEPEVKPQPSTAAAPPAETSPQLAADPIPPPAKAPKPVAKAGPSESKPAPPPVAAKSSSIKDRIAAFNKPGGAPVIPFKPSGSGAGFVKKFVPPPPARDSFVPPPRAEPPPKKYIRDEDPEIKEIESENRENAERVGFSLSAAQEGGEEDQPKPTSLQERIALLQRQQAEAAQRHADMAAKKEKPKRPPKKRTESSGAADVTAEPESLRPPPLERRDTEDTEGKTSLDEPRMPPPPRRKPSKGPAAHVIDGNEADMSGGGDTTEGPEELTEREDSDEKSRHPPRTVPAPQQPADDEDEDAEEEEDEEEDDVDPEIRRKEELRARMAKMSGGMGMPGMFMPFPGPSVPKKKKPAAAKEPVFDQEEEEMAPSSRAAPPVPTMMALPGMSHMRRSEEAETDEPESTPRVLPPALPSRQSGGEDEDDDEGDRQETPPRVSSEIPKVAGRRPAPPPVPGESRPPPPRPADAAPVSAGSLSDDELSEHPTLNPGGPRNDPSTVTRAPPPLPPSMPSPKSPSAPHMPPIPPPGAPAPVPSDHAMPSSPMSAAPPVPGNRASRAPPPIPGAAPPLPSQTRPPPPPPPGVLSGESTADEFGALPPRPPLPRPREESEEEEVTEYEGDYDTDIASSVPHKDALKASGRESSFEAITPIRSPTSPITEAPPSAPPPIPSAAAPRGVPPPLPSQPPPPPMPDRRQSVDAPRAAPPPPPPAKEPEEYDPYTYVTPQPSSGYQPTTPKIEEGSYPGESSRAPPSAPPPARPPPKQSLDVQRGAGRMSADVGRPSMDSGFIAEDLDLAIQSGWWKQANQVPPVLQGRKDVYYESEESATTNRGAKTVVTRTIHVLHMDYSQTVLTVRFDPYDPSDVEIDQRHEAPPRQLRQDQLEQSYERFGRAIYDVVTSKKDTPVGDGTPHGLIFDLLRPFRDALRPVGTRAYGALVYANMANASTQQNDQIRPGDIISIRNARFQGKHGAMHAKYSVEVGKPDHVAVVAEWDGTKKKVRAWEQGRESKKVKLESFKLDDLRSGEVKIWRVMPRSWVGWNTQP